MPSRVGLECCGYSSADSHKLVGRRHTCVCWACGGCRVLRAKVRPQAVCDQVVGSFIPCQGVLQGQPIISQVHNGKRGLTMLLGVCSCIEQMPWLHKSCKPDSIYGRSLVTWLQKLSLVITFGWQLDGGQ